MKVVFSLGLAFSVLISLPVTAELIWVSAQESNEHSNSRMIFSSERKGTLSLFSVDNQGKDIKLHVKGSVSGRGEYEPSVSPDGKFLAFTTYRYGGWKVAVSDIDGKNVRRVTMDPQYSYDPHWSPNGKSLVYRRIVPSGQAYYRGQADIYRINIDGSGNKNISNTPDQGDRKAAYAPNGKTVIYDSFSGKDSTELWLMKMDSDGGNRQRIESDSSLMFAPSWSPDGKWIAHLRADEEDYVDVWVMQEDGSNAKNLTNSKENGFAANKALIQHWQYDTNWTSDGRSISFVANYLDKDNIDIYSIDFSGEKISRMTQHKSMDIHPYWYVVK